MRDGVGMGDLRERRRIGVAVPAGMDGAVVPEPQALQGVRREARLGSDHLQRRLRLLLQPLSTRPLRDHPYPLQRVLTFLLPLCLVHEKKKSLQVVDFSVFFSTYISALAVGRDG